jgi:hypothetical protein
MKILKAVWGKTEILEEEIKPISDYTEFWMDMNRLSHKARTLVFVNRKSCNPSSHKVS